MTYSLHLNFEIYCFLSFALWAHLQPIPRNSEKWNINCGENEVNLHIQELAAAGEAVVEDERCDRKKTSGLSVALVFLYDWSLHPSIWRICKAFWCIQRSGVPEKEFRVNVGKNMKNQCGRMQHHKAVARRLVIILSSVRSRILQSYIVHMLVKVLSVAESTNNSVLVCILRWNGNVKFDLIRSLFLHS